MTFKDVYFDYWDLDILIEAIVKCINWQDFRDNVDYQQEAERLILMVVDWLKSKPRLQNIIRDYLKIMSQVPLMTPDERIVEGRNSHGRVILEVGLSGDTWKYCVDRRTLAEKSEWFRALLMGGMAPPPSDPPPIICLRHVDKRAFDHLFRYFCGEPVHFYSVLTARSTLDAAHSYLCPELARHAVNYIIKNLTPSTVLTVYHGLNLYASHHSIIPQPVSAGLPARDDATEIELVVAGCIEHQTYMNILIAASVCSQLFTACLSVIDAAPDQVLRQEGFDELTVDEINFLSSRDQLRLTKETTLFKALEKWAGTECRRRGLELSADNKRSVLTTDIWFNTRFLLMTDREFIHGPMASGILTSTESAAIVARILGHTDSQECGEDILRRLTTTPRQCKVTKNKKSMKAGKKERDDNKKNQRKECASQGQQACARVGDFVIRALACVFD